ncbi:MAG: tRNA (adenosine(37)-N6)-methyltransferase TrmM, partial [Paludibacteraceae bacterium]|nr:tRNA (adenosine(37)-N6)-methyltransferase TrmM [Paludibacteraceae bacterium]
PYFRSSLKCPDEGRKQARHTDTLSYDELVRCSAELLAPDGVLALILPQEAQGDILTIAAANGLHPWRLTHVRTSPNKPAKRVLIALTKEVRDLEEDELLLSHDHPLFKDFYL